MTTPVSWTGADTGGKWSTAKNWSDHKVPNKTTAVTIDLTATGGVTISSLSAVYSLTINNADPQSYLAIDSQLTVATTLIVNSGVVDIEISATVVGGTLEAGASGSFVYKGGNFNGVTFVGTLDLSAAGATLQIENGIDVESGSSSTGTVLVTGAGANLGIENTCTLSSMTVDVGNDVTSLVNFIDMIGGSQTFTLASSFTLDQTGGNFDMNVGNYSTDTLVNKGTMNFTESGGGVTGFGGLGKFVNEGSITVGTGDQMGIYIGSFVNDGTVTVDAGGQLGFGTTLVNDGTIDAIGKTEVSGNITGTGTIEIGSWLALGGSVGSGQTIAFTGAGEVLNDDAITKMQGSFSGLGLGDVLLLSDYSAKSVVISGGDLVLTGSGGTATSIALSDTSLNSASAIAYFSFDENDGQRGTLVLVGGTVYDLTTGADNISGGADNNLIVTTAKELNGGDNINAGGGDFNVMVLSGAGKFDLATPASLTGVDYFITQEGQAASGSIKSTYQTITSRAGLTGTMLIQSPIANASNANPLGITIHGAADSLNFDFSNAVGEDVLYLGSASESVDGSQSTGVVTINSSIANATAQIEGQGYDLTNAAQTVLKLATGGVLVLNSSDQDMTVELSGNTKLTLSGMNFIVALGGAGNDTITAGAQFQELSGGGGTNMLVGYSGFGDSFVDTSADLDGDTIKHFGGASYYADTILATDMSYTGQTASFVENSGGTAGTLSFSDGTHSVSMTLDGVYSSADFALSAGSSGGVLVTFV